MSKLDRDIKEVKEFIENIRFEDNVFTSEQNMNLFKGSYKQFHSLLIWGQVSEALPPTILPTKVFFRESLSDFSHACVLTLCHLYKPARLALRSGVENTVRSLLLIRGIDATLIRSAYELFNLAKSHFANDQIILVRINQLENIYGELCKTVHSAKIDYMSLTVPFEKLSAYKATSFTTNMANFRNACQYANQAIFFLWHHELKLVGHKNEDLIRDSIPKSVKRAVHL